MDRKPRNLIRRTLALAVLLTAPGIVSVGYTADLLEVYQQAVSGDPQLAAAEARFRASGQEHPLALSALLPQIDAYASAESIDQRYNDVPDAKSALYRDDRFERTTYGVRLDQSVFNKDARIRLEQAKTRTSQAEAEVRVARQELLVRVAEAYFNVLTAQDNLSYARAERYAIERQLRETRERLSIGMVAITDVKEAEAQFDIAVAQEIDALYQYTSVKQNLAVIIGHVPDRLNTLRNEIELLPPEPNDVATWVETALRESLTLQAVTQGLELSRQEIERRRGGHYPTLDLKADHGIQDDSGGFSEGKKADTTLALNLTIPLYDGGRTRAQTSEAIELHQQATHNHELTRRDVTRQTRAAYLNVLSAIARVQALRKALTSTQIAADAANTGYQIGTRTSLDVVIALRETYRAQRDFAKARYDYLLSSLRLKQAAGVLTPDELTRVNALLDNDQGAVSYALDPRDGVPAPKARAGESVR